MDNLYRLSIIAIVAIVALFALSNPVQHQDYELQSVGQASSIIAQIEKSELQSVVDLPDDLVECLPEIAIAVYFEYLSPHNGLGPEGVCLEYYRGVSNVVFEEEGESNGRSSSQWEGEDSYIFDVTWMDNGQQVTQQFRVEISINQFSDPQITVDLWWKGEDNRGRTRNVKIGNDMEGTLNDEGYLCFSPAPPGRGYMYCIDENGRTCRSYISTTRAEGQLVAVLQCWSPVQAEVETTVIPLRPFGLH